MRTQTEKATTENTIELRLPGLRIKKSIAQEIINENPDRAELRAENVERKDETKFYYRNEHHESRIKAFFN